MDLLNEGLKTGSLEGTVIGGDKHRLYQLYADNTQIFFKATEEYFRAIMDWLLRYEQISWAKINLSKPILVQLDQGPEPS
jgi:hypothetical protein